MQTNKSKCRNCIKDHLQGRYGQHIWAMGPFKYNANIPERGDKQKITTYKSVGGHQQIMEYSLNVNISKGLRFDITCNTFLIRIVKEVVRMSQLILKFYILFFSS